MTKTGISRWARVSALAVIAVFVCIQVVRPERTNPAIDPGRTLESRTQINPEVMGIFKRACDDCHSNETKWPWYSNVAPVSWFVIDHVNHGRRHLNFSDWARYQGREADEVLDDIAKEVKSGSMPLGSYLPLHPEAKLTPRDRTTIVEWVQAERARLAYGLR